MRTAIATTTTLRQRNINSSIKYTAAGWSGYFTFGGDRQHQGFPAGLNNLPGNYPYTLESPRQSITPLDWGEKQGLNFTGGVTATLTPGVEFVLDGGVRRKFQQALFYNYLDPNTFNYNLSAATPMNYVDTVMTTSSITPRFDISHQLFGVPNRLLTGVDFYNTQYHSDRPVGPRTGAGSYLRYPADDRRLLRPEHDVGAPGYRHLLRRPSPAQPGQGAAISTARSTILMSLVLSAATRTIRRPRHSTAANGNTPRISASSID